MSIEIKAKVKIEGQGPLEALVDDLQELERFDGRHPVYFTKLPRRPCASVLTDSSCSSHS